MKVSFREISALLFKGKSHKTILFLPFVCVFCLNFGCRGWRLRAGLGAGDQSSDVTVVQARGEQGLEQGSESKARRGS